MNLLTRCQRNIRALLSLYPRIYLPIARRLSTGAIVSPDTQLVIEGYPRSGNSFAEAAFRTAQIEPVRLAHHSHAAAQVLQAVKWRIPTLVVLRDPLEAARSLIMHHPQIFSAEMALHEYIVFHQAILSVRQGFILARFETVISDFGLVTDVINEHFGTSFSRFNHNENNEQRAFQLLEELSKERGTAKRGEPYAPSRSPEELATREQQKIKARGLFDSKEAQKLLAKANSIFDEMWQSADV